MTREEFEQLVEEEFEKAIPEKFRKHIKNVAFLVEDEPSKEVRKREKLSHRDTLLGYYHGIPLSARLLLFGRLIFVLFFRQRDLICGEFRLNLLHDFVINLRTGLRDRNHGNACGRLGVGHGYCCGFFSL